MVEPHGFSAPDGGVVTGFHPLGTRASARSAAAVTGLSLLIVMPLFSPVLAGDIFLTGWRWRPVLGLNAAFRLDGLDDPRL